jgi:hypothetical protein
MKTLVQQGYHHRSWQITGIVIDMAFPTYPQGFPADIKR